MINFAFPYAFLLLLCPLIIRYGLPPLKGMHGDALKIPFLADLQKIALKSGGVWGYNLGKSSSNIKLFILYALYICLVFAAARPQWLGEPLPLRAQSRDIMMIMDISNSMLEPDFAIGRQRINRLIAAKKTASDFLDKRANDRVGLILFGTRAYLQAPLTYDKASVKDILWNMDAGMAGNSTSIGDALGLALKNLKSENNDKVIILLTDGENNDGSLSMQDAISLAEDENVKIYTIGVGSETAFIDSIFGMQIGIARSSGLDEQGLKDLAEISKGRYFRAKDTQSLQKIYNEIDKLEPSLNQEQFVRETKELFYLPLLGALFFLFILLIGERKND